MLIFQGVHIFDNLLWIFKKGPDIPPMSELCWLAGQALGIPVGPLNDKKTVNVPLSQVGVFLKRASWKKTWLFF